MKTIGLIGGTSWFSTIDYYRIINETVNKKFGEDTSAKILLYSVNYGEIVQLTKKGNWKSIEAIISEAAKKLEKAGADCILLCANTMHIIAAGVQAAIGIPVLHIANAVLQSIQQKQIKTVLLLGTKYTMQSSIYSDVLAQNGIEIILPDAAEMEIINDSIYNELGKGQLLPETKNKYTGIINKYVALGAQGAILGCTEIPLLIKQPDSPIPIFDTTLLHAMAAVNFACNDK